MEHSSSSSSSKVNCFSLLEQRSSFVASSAALDGFDLQFSSIALEGVSERPFLTDYRVL
jgi:hypothetical protein